MSPMKHILLYFVDFTPYRLQALVVQLTLAECLVRLGLRISQMKNGHLVLFLGRKGRLGGRTVEKLLISALLLARREPLKLKSICLGVIH